MEASSVSRLVPVLGLTLLFCACGQEGPSDVLTDMGVDDASGDVVMDGFVACPAGCRDESCGFSRYCGMVQVPEGPFMMGCNPERRDDCEANQLPFHEVTLSAYHMDRTEVTVGAFRACVDAGACTPPVQPAPNCAWLLPDHENHPMTCVDWFQANAFCEWFGRRLPTEAEWEKAARGEDGRTYPWGEMPVSCDLAVTFDENFGGRGCGTDDTMPVCSRSPAGDSPYGLCDMAGNVWERVSDWFGEAYFVESPIVDPQGPSAGTGRVSRGGTITLGDNQMNLRTFFRNYHLPTASDQLLGFRCAVSDE